MVIQHQATESRFQLEFQQLAGSEWESLKGEGGKNGKMGGGAGGCEEEEHDQGCSRIWNNIDNQHEILKKKIERKFRKKY